MHPCLWHSTLWSSGTSSAVACFYLQGTSLQLRLQFPCISQLFLFIAIRCFPTCITFCGSPSKKGCIFVFVSLEAFLCFCRWLFLDAVLSTARVSALVAMRITVAKQNCKSLQAARVATALLRGDLSNLKLELEELDFRQSKLKFFASALPLYFASETCSGSRHKKDTFPITVTIRPKKDFLPLPVP